MAMLRHRALVLLVLVTAPIMMGARDSHTQDTPGSSFDPLTMSWAIWNSQIRAEFRLMVAEHQSSGTSAAEGRGPQGPFRLVSLSGPEGKIWAPPLETPASPIFLKISEATLDETTPWTHVQTSQQQSPRQGLRQAIVLRNDAAKVEVTVNLEVHPNQPFLRYWVELKNSAEEERFLTAADMLHWRFDTAGQLVMAFYINQYRRGQPFMFNLNEIELPWVSDGATVFSGSHGDHCSWLALNTPEGFGLVAGWEFDGRAHITARQKQVGDPLQILGGPDELYVAVGAGQSLTLPAAFLGLFRGDWDEAGYRTQRYVEAVLAHPVPGDDFPYLVFNTWGYETNIEEGVVRRAADLAASLGVEPGRVAHPGRREPGEGMPQDPSCLQQQLGQLR